MADFLTFISEQWLLVSVLVVLLYVFMFTEKQKGGKSVSLHEATRMINADTAVFVDIREKADYSAGHIVDALNLPFNQVKDKASELDKVKDKTLILVDKMGQHAGSVGRELRGKGFEVVRLDGGMGEWTAQNLPVVR